MHPCWGGAEGRWRQEVLVAPPRPYSSRPGERRFPSRGSDTLKHHTVTQLHPGFKKQDVWDSLENPAFVCDAHRHSSEEPRSWCRVPSRLGRPFTQRACCCLSAVEDGSGEMPATEALRAPQLAVPLRGRWTLGSPRPQRPGLRVAHCLHRTLPSCDSQSHRFSELVINLPSPGPSRSAPPQPAATSGSLARRTGSD